MKKEKILPDIAANIRQPYGDIPVLEFYEGYYDCVYIILHPFYRITDPDKIKFEVREWPSKKEITQYTKKLSWKEFLKISGLENKNRLDIALRNSIGGLVAKHKNDQDLSLLNQATEKYNLIQPGEGNFSELLIDDMLTALLELGYDWIFIGDEFGQERKLQFIQDIIDDEITANYHHESWYTPKNEILFCTHWDSHFTFLCSSKENVAKILEKYPFEGFYCDSKTEVYWSIQSPITD